MIFKLEGNAAFTASKERENELSSFAAILLPPESAHFYPDGNFRGNTMENSGKQNPKMGFKSPRARGLNQFQVLSGLYLDTYDNTSFYVKNVIY